MAQYDADYEAYLQRRKDFTLKLMRAFDLTIEKAECVVELFYKDFGHSA